MCVLEKPSGNTFLPDSIKHTARVESLQCATEIVPSNCVGFSQQVLCPGLCTVCTMMRTFQLPTPPLPPFNLSTAPLPMSLPPSATSLTSICLSFPFPFFRHYPTSWEGAPHIKVVHCGPFWDNQQTWDNWVLVEAPLKPTVPF